MLRKALYVGVHPPIMKWARESAGLDAEAVARKLDISSNTLTGWELGNKKPTLKSLEKLASLYKRPLAAFLLPKPPQEPPMPTDFRVLPEEQKGPLSPKTRLAIRRVRRVQSLVIDLMKAMGREPVANIGKAALSEDPELVAARERRTLEVSLDEQMSWRDKYVAFSKWKESLESLNIIVVQARIPIREARGFSLLGGSLPAIVVSASDPVNARIFTLFHEYAHLLLSAPGICLPNEASYGDANGQETDRFCNHFAGAFLVPQNALQKDRDAARLVSRWPQESNSYLERIASRFKVSKEVILRRMFIAGLISRPQFENKFAELQSQGRPRTPSFGVPSPRRCIVENGRLFVSTVLEARDRELITYSDLADYLSVNLKYLDKVEALLYEKK